MRAVWQGEAGALWLSNMHRPYTATLRCISVVITMNLGRDHLQAFLHALIWNAIWELQKKNEHPQKKRVPKQYPWGTIATNSMDSQIVLLGVLFWYPFFLSADLWTAGLP